MTHEIKTTMTKATYKSLLLICPRADLSLPYGNGMKGQITKMSVSNQDEIKIWRCQHQAGANFVRYKVIIIWYQLSPLLDWY